MKIVTAATDVQWDELINTKSKIDWERVPDSTYFIKFDNADAYFYLKDNIVIPDFALLKKPVFINAVIHTLAEIKAPVNVVRLNGWPTFLQRPVWEVAGILDENMITRFQNQGIKLNIVGDDPGFISARIIAMIINEAYFTVTDNISSKKEIDTAMKLGTSYPYGPFEWVELIGKQYILELLQKLNATDARYQPAALLIKEIKENK